MLKRSRTWIYRFVRGVVTTRNDEIDCKECLSRLDGYVDMELDGRDPAGRMPLVADHLHRCADCHQEYEGLLTMARAML
jgi:DNA-directed RNA polymerase subunit RPC12/RpoP